MKMLEYFQYLIILLIITNLFTGGVALAAILLVRNNDKPVMPSWAKRLIS